MIGPAIAMIIKANSGPIQNTDRRAARGRPQWCRDQAHLATCTSTTRDTALGHTTHLPPTTPATLTIPATRRHGLRHQHQVDSAQCFTKTRDTVKDHMTNLQRTTQATFTPIRAMPRHPPCDALGVDHKLLQVGIHRCRLTIIPSASVTPTNLCTHARPGTRRRELRNPSNPASTRPDPAWAQAGPASLGRGIIFPFGR